MGYSLKYFAKDYLERIYVLLLPYEETRNIILRTHYFRGNDSLRKLRFSVVIGNVRTELVGRDRELSILYSRLGSINPSPIILHGPVGSGKTALLRALTYLANRFGGAFTVLINASRPYTKESIKFLGTLGIHYQASEILRSLVKEVDGVGIKGVVRRVTSAISLITSGSGFRSKVLLVIDDLNRVMSREEIMDYCKSLYEWIKWDLSNSVSSALVIITTPHYVLSHEYLFRREVIPAQIWNLGRSEFMKLLNKVINHSGIDYEVIWYLTGGNPGALEWLMNLNWDLKKWLKFLTYGLINVAEGALGLSRLRKLAEDPDSDEEGAEVLERLGLMIRVREEFMMGNYVRDLELGTGKYWAWQIPAYPHLILKSDLVRKYLLEH